MDLQLLYEAIISGILLGCFYAAVSLGLSVARMNIVSKGEEQPFCTDETEASWQQNRRGHFIITEK